MRKWRVDIKYILIITSVVFIFFMVVIPLVAVISYAFKNGLKEYLRSVTDIYTIKALLLTLLATGIAIIVNSIFGLIAAFAITKYTFKGKEILLTLIEIPFAISPVISGLIFVLTYGRNGVLSRFLDLSNIKIVFAVPGVILVTVFITLPYVIRTILPILNAQGRKEEEAAALMGGKALNIFRKITFPHIKWAFLYGVILTTARGFGEFGAVSVISGHLRGKTNTLPLHIEILYNEFKFVDAFSVASILLILSVLILIIRNIVENKVVERRKF